MHSSRHSNSLQRVRAYYRAARSAALYYVVKPPSAKFSKFDALLLRLWCMDSSENLCAYETIHYACCVKILRECVEVARNTVTKCLFPGTLFFYMSAGKQNLTFFVSTFRLCVGDTWFTHIWSTHVGAKTVK